MQRLEPEQIDANFADINPAMTPAQAAAEANRCLFCYDAPCMHACPTHIDVPSFIRKIATGNLTGSARVIFDANPIGATCARVCPVEVLCEGACVEKTLINKPIEIGRLQRFATDHIMQDPRTVFEPAPSNGLSVAVVGSGPAGLSCAGYLARLGYTVTVFDRREKPGGLNTYGMAEYKMTQADSEAEVDLIRRLGVEFRLGTEITGNGSESAQSFASILEVHEAVFLAVGLGATRDLGIPGEDIDGVVDALSFIEGVKSRNWGAVPLGRSVAVIGAGNTAIDAATQAKRLGAERVMLVYRRTEADASAYDYELRLAKADGIEFHWQMTPTEIIGNGSVTAIKCASPDGERQLACDLVIKAIGQSKMSSFFTDTCGISIDDQGRVIVNENMQTSDPKIFAGGDCVNGGAEAVDAAQMGKIAAAGIHKHLTGNEVIFAGLSPGV